MGVLRNAELAPLVYPGWKVRVENHSTLARLCTVSSARLCTVSSERFLSMNDSVLLSEALYSIRFDSILAHGYMAIHE